MGAAAITRSFLSSLFRFSQSLPSACLFVMMFFSSHELSGLPLASSMPFLPLPPHRDPEPSLPARGVGTTGHFCIHSFFLVTYRKEIHNDQNTRHKGMLAVKPQLLGSVRRVSNPLYIHYLI